MCCGNGENFNMDEGPSKDLEEHGIVNITDFSGRWAGIDSVLEGMIDRVYGILPVTGDDFLFLFVCKHLCALF